MAKTQKNIRTLTLCAMFCAMAFALTTLSHFVLPPLFPAAAWLKYDPKDVILAVCALLLGPAPAFAVTVVSSALETLTYSDTGWIGLMMNIVASGAFILPGALLYYKRRKISMAVTGLLAGVVLMTGMMLLWNVFLTPIYMGMPRAAVVDMLVPVFLPFNMIKGALNAAITLILYKPLSKALRSAKLLPACEGTDSGKGTTLKMILIAVVILAVCAVVLLILNGKI